MNPLSKLQLMCKFFNLCFFQRYRQYKARNTQQQDTYQENTRKINQFKE